MYKYAQLKSFHHECQLQVYMYGFKNADPETTPVEDPFTATKTFVVNYKKMSPPVTVPKHSFGFSYIRSGDYELDKNFDDAESENNHTTHSTIMLNIYF